MAEISTIARPYAEAVFQLAQEGAKLKEWSDSLQICSAIAADADMAVLLGNTSINKESLAELFVGICGDKLTDGASNFVKLLAENRRLPALPEIARQFEVLKAEAEKTIEAELVSAFDVNDGQKQKIADALKSRLGCDVSLTCRTDDSLLGGAVIRAGDLVIDGSAAGSLDQLRLAMSR